MYHIRPSIFLHLSQVRLWGSSLIREAQTSLFPATSSGLSRGTPRCCRARLRDIICLEWPSPGRTSLEHLTQKTPKRDPWVPWAEPPQLVSFWCLGVVQMIQTEADFTEYKTINLLMKIKQMEIKQIGNEFHWSQKPVEVSSSQQSPPLTDAH